MIQLDNVSFTFQGDTENEVRAISDLNLKINHGEFVTIVGANGSGKSTLLNLLSGTLTPKPGRIIFEGTDVTSLKEFERSKWISRLFQNPLLGTASELSILENFRLAALRTRKKGLHIGTGKTFRDKVKNELSFLQLGLETKLDQNIGKLSGGQRQALTLLMGVMDEAKILLLDEPTAALDPKTSEIFMAMAERLIRERKLTTVFVTHHMKDAVKYGTRIIQLEEGRILRDIQGDKKSNLTLNELFSWFGD
ncbi:MAG: ATP-binding cassette domain-containing protein [Bacteroidia bacterium]|nr:ATP-binding cassette domain-containing protein [Bacteroidia bacterium]